MARGMPALARGIAVLVLAGALTATSAAATQAARSPAALSWKAAPTAPLRAPKYGQTNLSCTPSGFCLAVTSGGETATWNGSWQAGPPIGPSIGFVVALSCAKASFCVAVASSGDNARTINYAIAWTGHAWSRPVTLYTVKTEAGLYSSLHGVSCPSTMFCMTSGGGASFEFNGAAWTAHRGVISGTDGNGLISCSSPSFCANLHDDSANTWNGSRWRYVNAEPLSDAIPGANGFFSDLSCSSATFCVGVGAPQGAVVWNGARWRIASGAAAKAAGAVSCPSASFCVATSTTAHSTLAWNGSSWRAVAPFPLSRSASVSCARNGRCLAVTSAGASAVLS